MVKNKKRIDQIPDHLKLTEKEQGDYLKKFGIIVEKLSNGACFLSFNSPYPDKQYTEINARFRTGAWNDEPDTMGLAHFAEHAVFLGCPKAPTFKDNINRPKQGGYKVNGNTNFPSTNYSLEASSGQVNPKKYGIQYGLDHFLSLITEPFIPEESLANEKMVVIDEYQREISKLDYMATRFIWKQVLPSDHPQHNFISGTDKTLKNINTQAIKQYLETAYVPQNAFLSICSEGNILKHKKIARILKEGWLKKMKNRNGLLNPFPDYDWLSRYRNLTPNKIYREVLPIKKDRVIINMARILEIEAYSKDSFAFDMALNIMKQVLFESLRAGGHGYNPYIEIENIPFVSLSLVRAGIEVDSSKVELLSANLKEIFQKAIIRAIDHDYHAIEVEKKRLMTLDSPITYSMRIKDAFRGLFRFEQIVRSEDLDEILLSVKPSDVKKWLEDFADNPGNLFIVGDIK